jgi:putative Mn2+ efflux pump MntP
MKSKNLPVPLIGAIAATRALLGAGIGLLASSRVPRKYRRTMGFVLVGIGVATTVPIALRVFGRG